MTDSFRVFRCGTEVFARQYHHDYGHIYAKEAKTKGPLNTRMSGPYNYYDPAWHPFYHGTDLHTMQSISKTVTSIIFGVAITRGDFKASLNTPVLKYLDVTKVKNVDDLKRHMTVENLLTMTSGMNSEELFYPSGSDAPENDFTHLEASDDWVQYAIDEPIVEEPGKISYTAVRTPSCWPTALLRIYLVAISGGREICLDGDRDRRPESDGLSPAKPDRGVYRVGPSE
jgi:hypothetical protein